MIAERRVLRHHAAGVTAQPTRHGGIEAQPVQQGADPLQGLFVPRDGILVTKPRQQGPVPGGSVRSDLRRGPRPLLTRQGHSIGNLPVSGQVVAPQQPLEEIRFYCQGHIPVVVSVASLQPSRVAPQAFDREIIRLRSASQDMIGGEEWLSGTQLGSPEGQHHQRPPEGKGRRPATTSTARTSGHPTLPHALRRWSPRQLLDNPL